MDDILNVCKNLNEVIKESSQYREFVSARGALKSSGELYNRLLDFKRQYNDIQTYYDGNPYDEIYKLWDDNDDLLHNSLVSDYLKKENALSELVKKMVDIITDGLTNNME